MSAVIYNVRGHDNKILLNHNIFLELPVNPDRDVKNVIRWSEPSRKCSCVRGGTIVVGTRNGGTSITDRLVSTGPMDGQVVMT